MLSKNKQTLLIQKKQKKIAQKSRKLLDEKLSGLVKAFRESVIEGYRLEEKAKEKSSSIISQYLFSTSFINTNKLHQYGVAKISDETTFPYQLEAEIKKFFGIKIPSLNIKMRKLELENDIKPRLGNALMQFNEQIPLFLELIQARMKCQLLADEIKKTNRLIANIDNKIISISTDIKKIAAYLMEKENETKAVLIKIFNK